MIRLNREQNQAQARYAASLVDCLGNIATVLTLRLGEPTRRLVGARLAAVFAPLRSSIVLNEAKWCAIDLLNNGIRCGLVVLYVWLTWRQTGSVLLGSAVMVFQYAQQVGGVVGNMAGNYQDLVGYKTDLRGTDHIAAARARLPVVGLPTKWREIRIDGLSFTYAGKGHRAHALRDVTLTLRRGERIALVGESGSGKSTLLRVLAGLYQPDGARFVVDGVPRPEIADLGAITTLAPQDPEIFAGSIEHNLTLGIPYNTEAIAQACSVAAFAPVIEALPARLSTVIAERGLNLSGGQKQRLAVARALLAAEHSSLVLLDEPTSSLDPATEARVYDGLLAALADRCIISSVHRLHLLDRFDRVLLLAEGRAVDIGTAQELLERAPLFRDLWQRYGAMAPAGRSRPAEPSQPPWRVAVGR